MASDERVLDVREIDGEPFNDIMSALSELDDEESLLLLNSFEPVPLYDVLDERGFSHTANQEAGEWRIRIHREE